MGRWDLATEGWPTPDQEGAREHSVILTSHR